MRLPLNSGWLGRREEGVPRSEGLDGDVAAARSALLAHLAAIREPRESARARVAVRSLCDDARRRQRRAEQLLVSIKTAWSSLPEVSTTVRAGNRQQSLDRFISLCIEEYYARRD